MPSYPQTTWLTLTRSELVAFARKRGATTPEDIAQSACLDFLRTFSSGLSKSAMRARLFRAAISALINRFRERGRSPYIGAGLTNDPADSRADPALLVDFGDFVHELMDAYARDAGDTATAVARLCFVERLTESECASRLGQPISYVQTKKRTFKRWCNCRTGWMLPLDNA